MPWYTTAMARRDAERQKKIREEANLPTPECSTFCAYGEGCTVTADGSCLVLAEQRDIPDDDSPNA